jgi:hypothetical protein
VHFSRGASLASCTASARPTVILRIDTMHAAASGLPEDHGSPFSDLSPAATHCQTRQPMIGEM